MAENEMRPFWDRVGALLLERFEDDEPWLGYLEIVAHEVVYRSIQRDHGSVEWVSWEPFGIVGHFSVLTDPEASVRWVESS